MKPIMTFSLAVVLTSVLTVPGFAAESSEQAREANALNRAESPSQTTTPWSATMSSPNTPSHDGNSQLGKKGSGAQHQGRNSTPRSSTMGSVSTPSQAANRQLGQRDSALSHRSELPTRVVDGS